MIKRLQSMRDSADVMRKRKGIKSGIIGHGMGIWKSSGSHLFVAVRTCTVWM